MELLFLLAIAGFIIYAICYGISAIIDAINSSPSEVVKNAARFDGELRAAIERNDERRAIALLQALPRWPARGPLLGAVAALQRLRSGTGYASVAGVPEATLRDINERSRSCEYAICMVAVRVLATRLQSEQARFKSLPEQSRAALLRDTDEVNRITAAANDVHGHLTVMITSSPVRSGLSSLRDVGDGLAALSLAASRITSDGEWR